ncbi:MAG: hypothetical protein QM488_19180 [Rhizobiaceae bacterium]
MRKKSILKKSLLASAVLAVLVGFSPAANAVTLDFVAEAAGDERGLMDGDVINFSGLNVTFSATGGSAYFDDLSGGKPAGLGVCTTLNSGLQCTPSSDDNITAGEAVKLAFFDAPVDFSGLYFYGSDHDPVIGTDTLLIAINGGMLSSISFGAASAAVYSSIDSIEFGYDGHQFYIGGASAVVPIPAALPLFGTGLALMGFLGWRRKQKLV